jgi:hypothetical protein
MGAATKPGHRPPRRQTKASAAAPPGNPVGNRIPALCLVFAAILLFASSAFLPRVAGNHKLLLSFAGAAAGLLVPFFLLSVQVMRKGRILRYEFVPRPVHYIQLTMHTCVYAYWGWYWREVYHYAPLIVAQIAFTYAFDMLVCWWRRDNWILGFGPFPIVLSTNLFLWFRDDWFFLQFLLLATGVLGKEFIKWRREGRLTHIFNPSAFSLFVFSIGLIVTRSTGISWGMEIATTLHFPPHIYIEIFLIGLIVQALFRVTLVTLSAAVALYALNLAFTHSTGVYWFIDSNIPVSVFLGLHLLVTDPATSPRSTLGKILFGGAYGAGVFAMYGVLGWFDVPRFYDKLLCVPVLNLTVRALDRMSLALAARFRRLDSFFTWSPLKANFVYMAVWIAVFGAMLFTGFVGHAHPGSTTAFWANACRDGRWHACETWVHTLNVSCRSNSAADCFTLAQVLNEGRIVPRDPSEAGKGFGRACDLGVTGACASLMDFVRTDGKDVFERACDHGDGASCFILGSLLHSGRGVPRDDVRAVALFQKSCASGWWRGCGRLGESYLWGEGTAPDPRQAFESFEKACRGQYGPSCFNVAIMYRRGMVGPKDEAAARQSLHQACNFGVPSACQPGEIPAILIPTATAGASNR